MNSYFSKLYLDLCDHITEQVPAVCWVEQDLGQDQTDVRPNLAYPAVLIDFRGNSYSEIGGGGQCAESTVSIRLVCSTFSQSYKKAPDEVRQKALEYYEVERQLVDALHGYMPPAGYCTPLIRVSDATENRADIGLRIRTILFTTSFEDC